MKVVIQSNCGPYGLSRSDLEAAASALPGHLLRPIRQLVLVANPWGSEHFEYDPKTEIAYFAYPGHSSDERVREGALRALLLGLARLESRAEFRVRLSDRQRDSFRPFVDQWYPPCAKAIAAARRSGGNVLEQEET